MPTTNYLWDEENDSYLAETNETGAEVAFYENEPVHYGRLISQERDGVTSYYHYDGQGSTRELTDEDENVTDTYTYSAFGVPLLSSGVTVNPFRYGGEFGYYLDSQTADLSVRRRLFTPAHARWLSGDPMFLSVRLSTYVYSSNCPVSHVDPAGLFSRHLKDLLISMLTPEGGYSYCGDASLGNWFDRQEQRQEDHFFHIRGRAKGSLQSLVAVEGSGPSRRCGTQGDLRVVAAFEATSVNLAGIAFHSTTSQILQSTLHSVVVSNASCEVRPLKPYIIAERSTNGITVSGIGMIEICNIPCQDNLCAELRSDRIVWAHMLGQHQTKPGQMLLWQWRVCPESFFCCLSGCKASTSVVQLEDGWNFNSLGPDGTISYWYEGPEWGRKHADVMSGSEPKPQPFAIDAMIQAHKTQGGSVVTEPC